MNRKVVFFSLAVVLILTLSNFRAVSSWSAPDGLDLRRIDSSELAAVPPVESAIKFFQARIEADPQDAVSYRLLGEQFVRQARETGDASAYLRAEAALRESVRLIPEYDLANASLASVYYAQHDFLPALELAQQVHDQNSSVLEALAILGDAQLALGQYAEAEASYQKLREAGDTPPVLARLAALEELKGDPQAALRLMRLAARDALQAGGPPERVAWYVLRVGDIHYNRGEHKQAGQYYAAALRLFEDYHLALAGLAKVRAAQGDYDQAIAYYQQASARVPQPEYLAALGDLYTVIGQTEQADVQYKIVEHIGKLAEINQQIYNRQLANFYSDHDLHVKEALALALAELETRKDIYGYDAAAWAHYKNGHLEEAQTLMQQAMSLGTQDALLYYHAGMIEHALGNEQAARQLLEEALEINPKFSVLGVREASKILASLQ